MPKQDERTMKQRLLLLMFTLVAFVNSFATTYYIKFTSSDGTVYWPKLELVWNSRYSSYDTFSLERGYNNMEGELDFDEVWTNAGGSGTKKTINEIASGAFFSFSKLTSVSGTSIKKLRSQAFQHCESLTNINFPNLQTIESCAFAYCSSLVSYNIPASVTSIAGDAFYHSISLTNLTVDFNNNFYSCEDNILYNKYKSKLCAFLPCRTDTAFVVPPTIETIGESAFKSNWQLRSVIISNGVETIEAYAFSSSQIKSVVIPQSVTTIKNYSFGGCKYLESIKVLNPTPVKLTNDVFPNTAILYVPEGSKEVYENANYWNNVAEIREYHPSSIIHFSDATVKSICVNNWDYSGDGELDEEEAQNVKEIGTQFMNNTEITSFDELQYFTNLKHIAASAFSGCTNLTSIKVPASLTTIGYNAFLNTAWLNAQPDGVLYIGNVLYVYKGTMPTNTNITVKDGTTSICDYAFYNKQGLIGIEFPNTLISIGSELVGYVFSGCTRLTEIKIPTGVKSIVRYTFSNSGLKRVELPDGLESIGNSSFRSCTSLDSMVIPNRVTTIGKNAFRGCSQLQSIKMPYSLETVATDAFRDCNNLKAVHILDLEKWIGVSFEDYRATPLTYAHHLFVNDTEIIDLKIPMASSWAYSSSSEIHYYPSAIKPLVFYGCSYIKTVSIPKSISSIGDNVFYGCNSLTAVKMESLPFSLSANAFPSRSNISLYVPKGWVDEYQSSVVWNTFKAIKGYPDVDVNQDGDVDVVDIVDIVRYVEGNPSDAFVSILADLNNDNHIDIADAKQAVNSVGWSQTLTELSPEGGEQLNKLRLDNFEIRPRKSCVASIVLESVSDKLVGFQMDITLPAGLSLNQQACRIGKKIASEDQTLTISSLGNNTYRFTSVSMSLQPIIMECDELITLSLDASDLTESGAITVGNIRFVTSSSERCVLHDIDFEVQPVEYMLFCEGDGTIENPYLLYDANDFINLATDVNGGIDYAGTYFKVAKPEIDFSGIALIPIGTLTGINTTGSGSYYLGNAFMGTLDGNGVIIKNWSSNSGLFNNIGKNGVVQDIIMDATCVIIGTGNVGGITGVNEGTISNCINKADISSTEYHIGGICGDNMGTILECKNYGNITGKSNSNGSYSGSMIGGIAGDTDGGQSGNLHNAVIRNCENYGTVSSSSFEVGGIVGFATDGLLTGVNGAVENCINKGNIIGSYSVGGIIGNVSSHMTIHNNFVTGCTITGTKTYENYGAGVISKTYNSTFSNNFYTKDVVLKVGDQTFDGNTPRGVWGGYDSTTHTYLPKDITENCGAMLLRSFDFNGDGIVNALDIQEVINASAAESTDSKYDVNGDGVVNALDIQEAVVAAAATEARRMELKAD